MKMFHLEFSFSISRAFFAKRGLDPEKVIATRGCQGRAAVL
jgi:hypothetical protein